MARWVWMSVSTGVSELPTSRARAVRAGCLLAASVAVLCSGHPVPAQTVPQSENQGQSQSLTGDPLAFRVDSVLVRWAGGANTPVPEEVSRLISVRPGMRLRPLMVRQSVKQVFALGRFRDVRVRYHAVAPGSVRLLFELDPIPRIARVGVSGAPPGEERGILEELRIETGGIVPGDLPVRTSAAEEHLRSRGYLNAEIAVRSIAAEADTALEVEVTPGDRARLASWETIGAAAELERELLTRLRIAPGDHWVEAEAVAGLPDVEARLREAGFLFGAADLDWRTTDTGDVHLVLSVAPGPAVQFDVVGFGDAAEEAADRVRSLSEDTLSPDSIEAARQELLTELRRRGHRNAVITVEREDDSEGEQVFRFLGEPGPAFVVGSVSVEGAPSELAEAAAAALGPLEPGRPYRDEEWEAVANALLRMLRQHGFFEADVLPIEPAPSVGSGDPAPLDVEVRIVAGEAGIIRSVRFEGDTEFPEAELSRVAGIEPGAPYVVEALVSAREQLESFHRDRGYLEAIVEVEAPIAPPALAADAVFRIRAGSYSTVGEIIVAGLEATRDSLIRARLPFGEGDPLGSDVLLEARRRLVSLGIFRSVEVDLLEPEEAVAERNVLIRVEEAPRSSIGYGAGYSEREQVRGEGEWTRNNLFGRGHTLSLFGRFSLKGTRVVATYRGAENVEGEVPVFLSAFRESQDRESLDFIRSGVGVQVTRRVLGRNVYLRYDLTTSELFDLKISPNQIDRNFADNLWLSSVSASVVTDTRDDPVDPRRGRFGIVDLEWSSALLRSRAPFVKGFAQQYLFFPLGERIVLAAAGRLGLAWTHGADQPALVPITERFFAGGATTLRGFKLDRAGPLDPSGYPVGGNMLIVGNVEIRFPIFRSLRGAVFSDHGGVYREVTSFRVGDIGHNLGAGLRWITPLGPLRFDYGIRLREVGDAPRGQWHFTIGHAF